MSINICYWTTSDLLNQCVKLIKSLEGTAQGDQTAMAIYALRINHCFHAWENYLMKVQNSYHLNK